MERLNAVAVVYRLPSTVSGIVYPIRFQWYRAMPMDLGVKSLFYTRPLQLYNTEKSKVV